MSQNLLNSFVADCNSALENQTELSDVVAAIAPRMADLVNRSDEFLKPEHFQADPDHYARNLIYQDTTSCVESSCVARRF